MAIQEIDRELIGSVGFEKKIDDGAKNMVFDILQSKRFSGSSIVRIFLSARCVITLILPSLSKIINYLMKILSTLFPPFLLLVNPFLSCRIRNI